MDAFFQLPFDCRNKLENRAIVFDMVHFRDLDAACLADPAQIIAHQIDDHQQFSPVLLAFQQLLAIGAVLLFGGAPWPGAFDWPRLHLAVADLQEPFRRTAQQLAHTEVDECGKGSGVDVAQARVQLVGRCFRPALEALGHVDLIDVAGTDVLLDAGDSRQIIRLCHVCGKLRSGFARQFRRCDRKLPPFRGKDDLFHLGHPFLRITKKPRRSKMYIPQKMVHHDCPVVDAEEAVRNLDIIVRFLRQAFHLMTQLIAEVTDSSADKRELPCIVYLIIFQQRFQFFERIYIRFGCQRQFGIESDEGIAPQFFRIHPAVQEKTMLAVAEQREQFEARKPGDDFLDHDISRFLFHPKSLLPAFFWRAHKRCATYPSHAPSGSPQDETGPPRSTLRDEESP
ncbi:hypothetical protein SDC9_95582 [bioreactor metagenome]|uniref:Uncharacterized protein n=1 Tax=bioreactor metagenome TaxID=1076179 RepID=A0A645A6Q5_9ZZZZ